MICFLRNFTLLTFIARKKEALSQWRIALPLKKWDHEIPSFMVTGIQPCEHFYTMRRISNAKQSKK